MMLIVLFLFLLFLAFLPIILWAGPSGHGMRRSSHFGGGFGGFGGGNFIGGSSGFGGFQGGSCGGGGVSRGF
jgi:uncharacterized protein